MVNRQDRTALIELVAAKSEIPAVRRACLLGTVEVLGGFREIPPSTSPGWILRIKTQRGVSHLAVVRPTERDYHVVSAHEVPWHLWVGGPPEKYRENPPTLYDIYAGDHPLEYAYRKQTAQRRLE